jgi:hypothetical protein
MNDTNKKVMRKILYAVETGGQVYGKQDYYDFTEAYENSEEEHAITIGAGQWYGPEAKALLRRIHDADSKLWGRMDTADIWDDVAIRNWACYNILAESDKGRCIVRLISTPVGIDCQDGYMEEQIRRYEELLADRYQVTDTRAMMEWINIIHQGGEPAVKRLMQKVSDRNSVESIFTAMQSDTGNQVGAYRSRQQAVYNMIMEHAEEEKSMGAIEKAIKQMETWANDNFHGYDQTYRWGEKGDYDCSSAVIQAWELAGVPVKTKGATYTGNMYDVFVGCGFSDVTSSCNLSTGAGMQRGDVLLNKVHHTAMYCGNGKEVEASINEHGGATGGQPGDQTGKEFLIRSYRNYPWNYVLRYQAGAGASEEKKTDGRNTVLYPARMKKDQAAYTWAGTDSARSKTYPTIKKDTLVDVMNYTQKDKAGKNWYFVRMPHPAEGFVSVFVPAGSFRHFV